MGDQWTDFERFIVDEVRQLRQDVALIKSKVSALQVKASVWGLLAGLIPVTILILINIFTKE
jgi:hypothetical protein